MKWRNLLAALLAVLSITASAGSMIIYGPASGPMLEDPGVVAGLEAIGEDAGYTVKRIETPEALQAAFEEEVPALLFWGPPESVRKDEAALIRTLLDAGGFLAAGGGAPFWYLRDGENVVAEGSEVCAELTGVPGSFASGQGGTVTPFGERILGVSGDVPGGSRGGGAVRTPQAHWLPLVNDRDNPAVAVTFAAAYPSGGRFFYYGSEGLAFSPFFNPATPEGKARWQRLLASFREALPLFDWQAGQREFRNDGKTAMTLNLTVSNPGSTPLAFSGTVTVEPDARFGRSGEAQEIAEVEEALAPGESVQIPVAYRPPATAWGIYEFTLTDANGLECRTVLQLLPPGAVDYIDVDTLYSARADLERHLEIGLYSFVANYDGRLLVELPESGAVLHDGPVRIGRSDATSMTVVPVKLGPVPRDLLVRAALTDPEGNLIHDSFIRVEASEANPALVRRDIMFRAMNGSQFETEPELPADLEMWRDRWPLLRGLYIHQLPEMARGWMREHDFTLNYGLLLTDYPQLERWGLDDRNAFGRSAAELMPGHAEDPAKWLVWQHSRMSFRHVLDSRPEIVNLVEAVAGYQTPGSETQRENLVEGEYTNMSDIVAGRRTPPEEMAGKASHFLGYDADAVWRHREALAGRDGGLRILEPGGKRFRRVHLAELYTDLFNEPLPTPAELGIASYDEYTPIPLLLSHENGYFPGDRELKQYQVHYLIRCYFHMKRLDDLSAYLRAFAPEVHCVIGHDGPLTAQLSDILYRLPYLDTQTRWLFRSAYVMANETTFGVERHWVELGKRFGKRVGIHEEIGGGQWASYRTAKTSFISLFTKRAALDYRDLQVDFYHNRDKAYRVAEETAMFRGFQSAVDTGARPANDAAGILVVETNNSHYPSNYQGNYRWDLLMPPEPILSVARLLYGQGSYFHSTHTPLMDRRMLDPYRCVWLAAERYRAGDLAIVREWLEDPAPGERTLVLNHVGTLHANYLGGMRLDELGFDRPGDWKELGLPEARITLSHTTLLSGGGREIAFGQPLPVLLAEPPAGAATLLADAEGKAVVWSLEVRPGRRILYSGLPFGNIFLSETDPAQLDAAGAVLLQALGETRRYRVEPQGWFAAGYTLGDGRLAAAMIHPEEYKVAMSPHGADGDAVEAASAALGTTQVTFQWIYATAPERAFKVVDAWNGEELARVQSDAEGTLTLSMPAGIAELFFLEPL